MQVIDPGHKYSLASLDGSFEQTLTFVKRDMPAEHYPGNIGHYPGTTMQECLRVLINRAQFVNGQQHSAETALAVEDMRMAIWRFEKRAAGRHGRILSCTPFEIEKLIGCIRCGHLECNGTCHD